jgi:hypothetical protein
MKYLIILSFFFIAACEDRYEDPEVPFLGAHTKAEWEEISRKNWEAVNCMNDPKNVKLSKNNLEKLYKICNVKEISRVGN